MVKIKEINPKLFILSYVGTLIIVASLFFSWINFYGTLPTSTPIQEQVHSVFDNGITGWEIISFSNEGWTHLVSSGISISMIILLIIALCFPIIFYGNWKGLFITGILAICIILAIFYLSADAATSAGDVGWYPLIGFHIAFVGGIVLIISSWLLKMQTPEPSKREQSPIDASDP